MNKAFVKEPEQTNELHCPKCGSLGSPVGHETLAAQLSAESLRNLAATAFFCAYARCPVVYFDMFERVITTEEVAKPVYPKDPSAPICSCFGLTADDIEQDVREGVATRCKEVLAKAKSPEARCVVLSPCGQSCVAEVQRYFMKYRAEYKS
jgi:hypothetical protein